MSAAVAAPGAARPPWRLRAWQAFLLSALFACIALVLLIGLPTVRLSPTAVPLGDGRRLDTRRGRRTEEDKEAKRRDAQFLVQSSFGPTRVSLDAIQKLGGSHADWIKKQINTDTVPMKSHRAYYRERVNAHWDNTITSDFSSVGVCDKGSRWANYVFTEEDIGKVLEIQGDKIWIKGKEGTTSDWKSDIDLTSDRESADKLTTCTDLHPQQGGSCTDLAQWAWCKEKKDNHHSGDVKLCQQTCYDIGKPYEGDFCYREDYWKAYAESSDRWLCTVEESVGGRVSLSADEHCTDPLLYIDLPNPAIWKKERPVKAGFPTASNPLLPGVIFLNERVYSSCELTGDDVVEFNGKYYRHDSRVALLGNTIESPQTSEPSASPKKNFLNKDDCLFVDNGIPSKDQFVACGSPGEVASVGVKGHLFPMITMIGEDDDTADRFKSDKNLDSGAALVSIRSSQLLVKSTVWTMMALYADDQLRQRTAWSMSQILVVGMPGLKSQEKFTESWLNFYDIFVRHAFGNFRDILQEVTYSPIMGRYLSYEGSRSYNSSESYPDENYAREIMQLFTIGVDQLNGDGTVVKNDTTGVAIPAYTNDHIMNFARVFTGFKLQDRRGNAEMGNPGKSNFIDPMTVMPEFHDRYPKPDLDGNFLGDKFRLCTDLSELSFLEEGARYEFLGQSYEVQEGDKVETLDVDSSKLAKALETIAATVTLDAQFAQTACTITVPECKLTSRIDIVKVTSGGGVVKGFYEYVAPTCVHHFFNNGEAAYIHDDGKVSAHTTGDTTHRAASKFAVKWEIGAPEAGEYTATVEGSNVSVEFENVTHKFPNPPVFIQPRSRNADPSNRALARAVFAESESLIDHLFLHPNTPVNIGKKLIQRFVTSNPSPAYIEAVAGAFRRGNVFDYPSLQFSDKYGDLGATVAAILLHAEARDQTDPSNGLLREPMLKLIHFMRSMEYGADDISPVVLTALNENIGQFPYSSETVFNFYNADYIPARYIPADYKTLVAPEFQIFTPPFALRLLNGIFSLINEKGLVSNKCGDGGFGVSDGEGCKKQGSLAFVADGTHAVEDLNVLLTGGRLTTASQTIVTDAYDSKGTKRAQRAIVMTAEFNTLGDATATVGASLAQDSHQSHRRQLPIPYKAVVMVFLAGGADTYQMLVPLPDCSLHDSYVKARGDMALGEKNLYDLPRSADAAKNDCTFGMHGKLKYLYELYKNENMAFVSNVGALVKPVNFTELQGGHMQECPSQFSHYHAQAAAQTLRCGLSSTATAPLGIGGRMADLLHKKKMNTASFSVSGAATWSQAVDTRTEILDPKEGAIRFQGYKAWKDEIDTITSQGHANAFCEGYAAAFNQAIKSSEELGSYLDNITLDTYEDKSALQQQLKQVARLIKTYTAREAERDFFFVQSDGWDMHQGILKSLPEKFEELDNAIEGFVEELKEQDMFKSVVLVTASDFGRTLSFNGKGTDHGWGGNHIIVGGGIKGGKMFNNFLETYDLGSEFDADRGAQGANSGRGRVIPKYPWESVMVPIAEWVGIEDSELKKLFENWPNFEDERDTYIIRKENLFKDEAPPKPATCSSWLQTLTSKCAAPPGAGRFEPDISMADEENPGFNKCCKGLPNPCTPLTVTHASGGACKQGDSIGSGLSCTTQCDSGYIPTTPSLSCLAGTLSPSTFTCKAVQASSSCCPLKRCPTCANGNGCASSSASAVEAGSCRMWLDVYEGDCCTQA